jgi:prepilin-type N-terminal cleavage/methylation domain-containing protein
MRKPLLNKQRNRRSDGFSLIELLIAMMVLVVGLLGGMVIIITAVASNARSRMDTAAVALAQSTMDRIIVLSSSAAGQQTQMTDCNANVHAITTSVGGSPTVDLANIASGGQSIDFSQAAVNGYQMLYTLCDAGAADPDAVNTPQTYDVRWAVKDIDGTSQLILVAAKNITENGNGLSQSRFFSLPITLRAIRGN